MASQFIFPARGITPENLVRLLHRQSLDDDFVMGTDDLLLIGEPEEVTRWQGPFQPLHTTRFQSGIMQYE